MTRLNMSEEEARAITNLAAFLTESVSTDTVTLSHVLRVLDHDVLALRACHRDEMVTARCLVDPARCVADSKRQPLARATIRLRERYENQYLHGEVCAGLTTRSAEAVNFETVWRRAAAAGLCDELDGAEYQRVRREWSEANEAHRLVEFIRGRANLGPEMSV